MTQPILLKRSATAAKVPLATDLQLGELAVNTTDGKVFMKLGAGTIQEVGFQTFTGDATGSGGAGNIALTLAASGVTAGTYNNAATAHTPYTVDAKGRITGTGAAVTITPAWSSVTGKPTTLSAMSFTDVTAISSTTPAALGTAAVGTSTTVARSDHVHAMPTAAQVGALSANQTITLSGDLTGSGTTAITGTLATVNSNVGSFGSTSVVPVITVNGKGLITAATTATITPAAIGAVATTALGANSGVATLDSGGKVPTSQLPAAVLGGMNYQGTWNASTNSPALASGTGTKGFYYKVSVAGATAIDGISQWNVGDMLTFNGTVWDKIDGLASEVSSVAGRVGAITLTSADVSGLAASATTDPTNAANISSGILAAARLPAFSGDATTSAGSTVLTLANSGVTAGTYENSATANQPITVDAKGRITAVGTAVTITPAWASITATPTTLAGYNISDALSTSATIDGGAY